MSVSPYVCGRDSEARHGAKVQCSRGFDSCPVLVKSSLLNDVGRVISCMGALIGREGAANLIVSWYQRSNIEEN